MIPLVVSVVITLTWWLISLAAARREYRHVYREIRDRYAKTVYGGGRTTHESALRTAKAEAVRMAAFWPVILPFRGILRLITGPEPAEPVLADPELIERLEQELGIGDHQSSQFTAARFNKHVEDQPYPPIIVTPHPERVRVIKPWKRYER